MALTRFSVCTQCTYHGFMYVDTLQSPGSTELEHCHEQFKSPKKLRKDHPLFARGFSKALTITANEEGFRLDLPKNTEGGSSVVSTPMRKIVHAGNVKKSVYIMVRRGTNKFNCHHIKIDSANLAKDLAELLSRAIREQSSMGIRSQSVEDLLGASSALGPVSKRVPSFRSRCFSSDDLRDGSSAFGFPADPATPQEDRKRMMSFGTPDSGIGSEPATPQLEAWSPDQAKPGDPILDTDNWFRGVMTRQEADTVLHGKESGTFLVRVSQSRSGFSLSLVLKDKAVEHFKITQSPTGEYYVVGNSFAMFGGLMDLVQHYNRRRLTKTEDLLLYPIGKGPNSEEPSLYM